MEYEEDKVNAKRKLTELIYIFRRMEHDRAATAELVATGQLKTARDVVSKHYYLAQMAICQMCVKLVEAVEALLDA